MPKKMTTTQISAPAPEFEGYGAQTLEGYGRQQFNPDGSPRDYTGPSQGYAGLNPLQSMGYGLGAQALGTQNQYPGMANQYAGQLFGSQGNLANQNYLNTLSGAYLNPDSNPYIRKSYDRSAKALSDNFNSAVMPGLNAAFGQQGAMGGSAHRAQALKQAGVLGSQLSDLSDKTYGDNYARERALQAQMTGDVAGRQQSLIPQFGSMRNLGMQDAQNALGLGGQLQQFNQGQMDSDFANQMRAWNHLQQKYPQMAQMLATASRGTGMQTGTQTVPMLSDNPAAMGLGAIGALTPLLSAAGDWMFNAKD